MREKVSSLSGATLSAKEVRVFSAVLPFFNRSYSFLVMDIRPILVCMIVFKPQPAPKAPRIDKQTKIRELSLKRSRRLFFSPLVIGCVGWPGSLVAGLETSNAGSASLIVG